MGILSFHKAIQFKAISEWTYLNLHIYPEISLNSSLWPACQEDTRTPTEITRRSCKKILLQRRTNGARTGTQTCLCKLHGVWKPCGKFTVYCLICPTTRKMSSDWLVSNCSLEHDRNMCVCYCATPLDEPGYIKLTTHTFKMVCISVVTLEHHSHRGRVENSNFEAHVANWIETSFIKFSFSSLHEKASLLQESLRRSNPWILTRDSVQICLPYIINIL